MGVPPVAHLVHIITYHSAATLFLAVYDILLTLGDEIEYIWSKSNTAWIKWNFLFIRYFALGVQFTCRFIQHIIVKRKKFGLRYHSFSFRIWFIFQVVIISGLMIAVEAVLMARVYALYNRSRWVKYTFLALVGVEIAATVVGIAWTIPHDFTDDFLLLRIPGSIIYFSIAAAVSQMTIIILTLIQYWVASRAGWSRNPIFSLMLRDGTGVFVILFMECIVSIINVVSFCDCRLCLVHDGHFFYRMSHYNQHGEIIAK